MQPKPAPERRNEGLKHLPPPASSQHGVAPHVPKGPSPGIQKPATARPPFGMPSGARGPAPKSFGDIRKGRQEKIEDGGRRKVIQEPGNRIIIKQSNRIVIRQDEAERFRRRPGAKSERRPDGNVETFYVRPDGVRIVTVVDAHGRLLRRYRRDRDGHEHSLIDNRRFYRNVAIGVGLGVLGIVALNLPPPRVTIPRERYIVDYDRASDDDLYETLEAEPIEALERAYSLAEIRDNYELRARTRRIDLDAVTFDTGVWEVSPDQYDKLERIARAMLRVLRDNDETVFLIEGHTDAVGNDEDNASLSSRRAEAVAEVLSETFNVPPENLVTQGYGEQYLKIDTQDAEPRNRRVTIRNITRLMAER